MYLVDFKIIVEHQNRARDGATYKKIRISLPFVPRKNDIIKLGDVSFRIDYARYDIGTKIFEVEMWDSTYEVEKYIKRLEELGWEKEWDVL